MGGYASPQNHVTNKHHNDFSPQRISVLTEVLFLSEFYL